MRAVSLALISGLILPVIAHAAAPRPAPAPCSAAIAAAERGSHLPPKLMGAIALVESGRYDPARRAYVPWPWTIDVGGNGYFFDSKEQAIAAVTLLQATGTQSIDVGCMQINLMHHPNAFRTLDDAFDPKINAAYAARFLTSLYAETSNWPQAAADYHSRTPDIAAAYEQRVMAVWPLAERYGEATISAGPAAIDPDRQATPQFVARLREAATARRVRVAAMPGPALAKFLPIQSRAKPRKPHAPVRFVRLAEQR